MEIQENIPLASWTTLGVGGNAMYFAVAFAEDEVREALEFVQRRNVPFFVLGGGSNLLVSDRGFPGLVLRIAIGGIEPRQESSGVVFRAGAGVEWDSLVERTVAANCAGLECLSGIPGSVGGTPVQNVGAYGQEVASSIVRVEGVEIASARKVAFSREECGFHYRHSRFNQQDAGRYILTFVEYALRPGGEPQLAYTDLKRHFADTLAAGARPSLAEVRQGVLEIRRRKGMVFDENDPDSHSAGSFFKNPVVSREEYARIAATSTVPVPHYDAPEGRIKLAAAWLIEQSGISRGFALGPAAVSGKHTLALTNRGGATATDIVRLKEHVEAQVLGRFGVQLQPEPVLLGF
ncbi:MAG: UDP-N-acetylmuramate dehydrogenase [Acidobacteriota bacterium]|nr:UDP-N-acetylmuramate dehydrogenase [Acidobacteriota bacterium]